MSEQPPNRVPPQQQAPSQPGYPQAPMQRNYPMPRYIPPVTSTMRAQAPVTAYQGGPVQAGWTAGARTAARPGYAGPGRGPGYPVAKKWNPNDDGAHLARLIIAIVAVCLLGLGLAVILLIASLSFHGLGVIVVILSSLPLLFIVGMVLWFDRWKPQPKLLMAACILWGAVAAVVGVVVFQALGIGIASLFGLDLTGDTMGAVVMAPLFEESFKGVFLVVLVLAGRKYFTGPLDGWVYGSLLGAGFAFTENLLYLSSGLAEGSAAGLVGTFVMRCLMSPLLHSTFVMCAGVSIGLASRRGQWWLTIVAWLPGMFCGMVLHGSWNAMATLTGEWDNGLAALAVTLAFSLLISCLWFGTGLFLRSGEAKATRRALGDYANAGWLTHDEVSMLGTWAGRRAGRRWARRFPGAIANMNRMISLSADLAAIRMRLLAQVAGAKEVQVERFELEEFTRNRRELMQRAEAGQRPGGQFTQQLPGVPGPGAPGTPGRPQAGDWPSGVGGPGTASGPGQPQAPGYRSQPGPGMNPPAGGYRPQSGGGWGPPR
ncbi:PrsW family glutamic-type intramembrane protease [Brevibacterium sp. 50QC2O2]|uniref:PrsW family intramembrane metalloprotease n=1 Tax=unclassified Brevibacterium TaxID=2614124 RepID=UPI00211C5912|nr:MULTISPECIES: PrsW family intramembrane metalloprotease [unclassified Brevibacterium]MCQ9367929.1 PrsW family glutamic-type intramembrane protease [Brevibacterium sp. 91QC2O2]MCQ9387106.1 PrsW family glutamic-type intramembrane protease [Brevibacterium sp. 50QC2O2]